MTTYRSQLIREVETDLIESRARGYLKHRGQTYTDYKIERRQRMKVYQAFAIGCAVLALVALLLKTWVG